MRINGPRVRIVLVTPHRVQQPIARERFAGMRNKIGEQSEFFRRKINLCARAQHCIAAYVHLNIAESIDLWRGRWWRDASQHSLNAGHQFANRERLSDIIVSAKLQADDLVDLLATRRQHDNWQRGTLGF